MQRRCLSVSTCAGLIVCAGLIGWACSPARERGPGAATSASPEGAAATAPVDAGPQALAAPEVGAELSPAPGAAAPSGAPSEPSDAGALGPGPTRAGDAGGLAPSLDAGSDPAPAADAPVAPELAPLLGLSARLAPLAERTASFWLVHGPDAPAGGFHATLDRRGAPAAPEDKGLIQQARHLWMLSTWYERRAPTKALLELAARQYEFLRSSFVDADGAFVYRVSRDGSRVVDARKQLFAESYALYALATYGRVFRDEEATELALARFDAVDASRHDPASGGYDQRGDPGSLGPGAAKDANTHLHLLEAFSALYEASAEPRVGERLSELIDLFVERLRQPGGYIHAEFSLEWAPLGAARVSYGHDLETAWLLLEAARVLGREGEPTIRSAALAIASHSGDRGFDARDGGYFEAGVPGGAADDLDKVWWVQFEALQGLWWAYVLSGETHHLERLERTLGWIELTEDRPIGEWFAASRADGSAAGADYKSDEWKASYHSVRALVFLQDWIDEALAARAAR